MNDTTKKKARIVICMIMVVAAAVIVWMPMQAMGSNESNGVRGDQRRYRHQFLNDSILLFDEVNGDVFIATFQGTEEKPPIEFQLLATRQKVRVMQPGSKP